MNKANIRRYVLARCKSMIPGAEVERVSAEVAEKCDTILRNKLVAAVRAHKGIGKTFKGEMML